MQLSTRSAVRSTSGVVADTAGDPATAMAFLTCRGPTQTIALLGRPTAALRRQITTPPGPGPVPAPGQCRASPGQRRAEATAFGRSTGPMHASTNGLAVTAGPACFVAAKFFHEPLAVLFLGRHEGMHCCAPLTAWCCGCNSLHCCNRRYCAATGGTVATGCTDCNILHAKLFREPLAENRRSVRVA